MIQTIVTYLNAKLATLGRFDTHYCLTERRRREGDGATIPYSYTGAGEYVAVDIDNGSSTWWRGRSGFTLEPVTVVGRAVKQQQGSYPLRLIAILRRKDSTSDDAFMPSRLAEDIANVLNFENGDLRTMLGAWSVTSRATGGEYDTTAIWTSEFQTTVPDLDYKLCMVSVDVTIDVVADYKCWEGECETDPDILHLFNFCDSSVVARLTDEQRECLREALPTPCDPATVELNGVEMATIASGDTENIEVRQSSGATLVGSQQGQHWRIGDSDIEINGTQVASVKAEDGLDIPVIQDGSPVGSWNGTQWVIPSCPAGATVTLAVSDTTPNVGDSITITATATNFTPTTYLFYAQQGGQLFQIGEQSNNVINWTVSIVGTFKIFVNGTDSPIGAFNAGGLDVTSNAAIVTTNIQLWQDPFRSNVVPPTYPDISGFGRDGTMVNNPTFVAGTLAPNNGGYTEFNGVDQSISSIGTVSDFSFIQNTLQFTIGAWVRVGDLTGRNIIAGNTGSSTQKGFTFNFETANYGSGPGNVTKKLILSLSRGVSGISNIRFIFSDDNVITTVGWNYVAVTMNGLGTAQYYLNGVPITTTEIGNFSTLPTGDSSRELSVGRITLVNYFFTGRIGPVQIYDIALTASEIQQNFETDRYRYGI